ncbi:MAG: type III-B CRISPR module RAMP protein Cmr4 [Candidatus Hydrothermales bacterium]
MYKENLVLTFYAQTPIHMGSGISVSYVDNPVQREKHTEFPILAASGIKGVIRDLALRIWQNKNKVEVIFGPEPGEGQEFASCISLTDAKILLFPVRSVRGVFAYITCPYILKRFKNELKSIGKDNLPEIEDLEISDSEIIVHSNSKLNIDENKVVLEEFVFNIKSKNKDELVKELLEYLPNEINPLLNEHFAIVSDDVFKDFAKYAVEIRTRIRIDQITGTAAERALFEIELLPSETVFYGFIFITDPYNKSVEKIQTANNVASEIEKLLQQNSIIQLGGDETLGMGLMRVKVK